MEGEIATGPQDAGARRKNEVEVGVIAEIPSRYADA